MFCLELDSSLLNGQILDELYKIKNYPLLPFLTFIKKQEIVSQVLVRCCKPVLFN